MMMPSMSSAYTGLFAEKAINAAGADGLIFGGLHLFFVQILLVIVAATYAVAVTWVLFKLIDALVGMRVERKDELIGLDLTQHNESAYTVLE
jgi:Amt family ammonium transporter